VLKVDKERWPLSLTAITKNVAAAARAVRCHVSELFGDDNPSCSCAQSRASTEILRKTTLNSLFRT
jgi:hypothetical protein